MLGLCPRGPAELDGIEWLGNAAMVTFRDSDGVTDSRMMFAAELSALRVLDGVRQHPLDAPYDAFALAAEALRLAHAPDIDPYQAVNAAAVEPLPHQLRAVYQHMLPTRPLRFLLADDPGAGKTVMAGLYLKEALARGWVRRVLIVAPGGLVEQWQEELRYKLGLTFALHEPGTTTAENPFVEQPCLIVRLDQVARNKPLRRALRAAPYDLAIVDEAHKMSARYWSGDILKSRRYELGELLRDTCRGMLLMTATPHNGKDPEFHLLLGLLGGTTVRDYLARDPNGAEPPAFMRRLLKEQLVHADGSPLFPPRRAETVGYQLSARERALYEAVSEYVRHEMNKVTGEETRRTVGFALTVLQRRLASSPEAILRSLTRRRDRLREQAGQVRQQEALLGAQLRASLQALDSDIATLDQDEVPHSAVESVEDAASWTATASRTPAELETEALVLDQLVIQARDIRDAGIDRKWEALAGLLLSPAMVDQDGQRRKIIIFTEHRDTLDYLSERLSALPGPVLGVERIHGGSSRGDRRLAQLRFAESPYASVLLATDAAGEGVNLQVAHLMVNYDIPWNPNRLEQRFGRIHRIGQRHTCQLWNLVATDTREGDVFTTLLEKLERQRAALGDQVFDVLGDVLSGAELRDLLTDVGADRASRAERFLERKLGTELADAVSRRAAPVGELTAADLAAVRRELALSRAAALTPDITGAFVGAAMEALHGDLRQLPGGRWRVGHVPREVREQPTVAAGAVRARYEAVTFSPRAQAGSVSGAAELVAPGHPLLTALVGVVGNRHGEALRRGVVLMDDRSTTPYLLAAYEAPGHDATTTRLHTVAVAADGAVTTADPAGFTSLAVAEVGQPLPPAAEVDALLAAATRQVGAAEPPVAVAYVQGGAREPADRQATLTRLRAAWSEAPVWEGPPFAGWDLCREDHQGLTFATVANPDEAGRCSLRRCEVIASRNLAGQHWWVTGDGGVPRWASASDLPVPAPGHQLSAILDWRAATGLLPGPVTD
ncbi:hypothetical protein GCM10010201_33210 [Pilimelia columellifera subsp. columellifera]|uniref:Helicase n=1 Tax=Pilimelia columellifera subsp. columellifera TaxID=706583 RepID=A0ABN3NQH5_9ACTN